MNKGFTPLQPKGPSRGNPRSLGVIVTGFTLIELLVYSALAALVITFAIVFAISIMKETAKSSIKEEVQRNVTAILRAFDFEVHHARSIYNSTSDFVGNPGRLSLLSTLNAPGGETSGYLDMYVDDDAFCLKRELAGVSCITSSNVEVSGLTFTRLLQAGGQESVRMRATVRYVHVNSELQFPLTVQTTARLREY